MSLQNELISSRVLWFITYRQPSWWVFCYNISRQEEVPWNFAWGPRLFKQKKKQELRVQKVLICDHVCCHQKKRTLYSHIYHFAYFTFSKINTWNESAKENQNCLMEHTKEKQKKSFRQSQGQRCRFLLSQYRLARFYRLLAFWKKQY